MVHYPRLLCLHGGGASAAILHLQFAKLECALSNRFQLVYLEAPLESAPGPGVLPFFENYGQYSCWVSDDSSLPPQSKREEEDNAIAYIKNFMLQHGPFAGILGFSQGARATATMLLEQQKQPFTPNPLFGVVFCGTFPPFVPGTPEIMLPTLHVLGLSDPYLQQSELLLRHCTQQSVRRVIKFNGGHQMPTSQDVTQQIADAISMLYRGLNRKRVSTVWQRNVSSSMTATIEI